MIILIKYFLIYLEDGKLPLAMITTMKKLKSGYINGTRVTLGNLNDFLSTSCITNLSFLGCHEDGLPDSEYQIIPQFLLLIVIFFLMFSELHPQVQQYMEEHSVKSLSTKYSLLTVNRVAPKNRHLIRKMSVRGAVKKTRSINVDCKS